MRPQRPSLCLLLLVLLMSVFGGGAVSGCSAAFSEPTVGTSGSADGTPLRVGLIPNIAPEEQKAKYEPLKEYLESALGEPVELFVATNYAGVVQAMASGKLDLAYFGGLTYAQALEQVPLEPIVTEIDAETGTEQYYSLIIAGADSGVGSLDDLQGKSFAFGDPASTSGSLYPRLMLDEAGFDWREDFAPISEIVYSGGHDATAKAVETGSVAAGGIEGRILARLVKEGKVDGSKIKVVDKRLVQGYPWCVASAVDAERKERIRQAFLDIEDEALLDLLRARRYVAVDADDYTEIRDEADRLGLLEVEK